MFVLICVARFDNACILFNSENNFLKAPFFYNFHLQGDIKHTMNARFCQAEYTAKKRLLNSDSTKVKSLV